uniref:Uncharacterized protein n=1 Tax=Vitrella brassicaformis TaxID=1169539 RepID=A0A7S1JU45_9ALVE|mmetsp:Transcript_23550/g.58180  ORF Transcript_23550/g.58180 Transcript_23550/m.58180 type:complete len:376 (+) Transcript_23550:88-1215(+)
MHTLHVCLLVRVLRLVRVLSSLPTVCTMASSPVSPRAPSPPPDGPRSASAATSRPSSRSQKKKEERRMRVLLGYQSMVRESSCEFADKERRFAESRDHEEEMRAQERQREMYIQLHAQLEDEINVLRGKKQSLEDAIQKQTDENVIIVDELLQQGARNEQRRAEISALNDDINRYRQEKTALQARQQALHVSTHGLTAEKQSLIESLERLTVQKRQALQHQQELEEQLRDLMAQSGKSGGLVAYHQTDQWSANNISSIGIDPARCRPLDIQGLPECAGLRGFYTASTEEIASGKAMRYGWMVKVELKLGRVKEIFTRKPRDLPKSESLSSEYTFTSPSRGQFDSLILQRRNGLEFITTRPDQVIRLEDYQYPRPH